MWILTGADRLPILQVQYGELAVGESRGDGARWAVVRGEVMGPDGPWVSGEVMGPDGPWWSPGGGQPRPYHTRPRCLPTLPYAPISGLWQVMEK